MATFEIPRRNSLGEKFVRQLGESDTSGELWGTLNIDLVSSKGKIKLARPLQKVANDTNLGDDWVRGFAMSGGTAYAVTEENLYSAGGDFDTWSLASNRPEEGEDVVIFDNSVVFTTDGGADLGFVNSGGASSDWWTDEAAQTALTAGIPHMLNVVRIGEETITVTDGNSVRAYTGPVSGGGGGSTLIIDAQMTAICVKASVGKVWIGTFTEDGDQAYVYEWDGTSEIYSRAYPVGAKACLSMEVVNNVPYIVTEKGEVKAFNGSGFEIVAKFPFADKVKFADGVETGLIQSNNISRPVHPKGMAADGNIIYIHCNWENAANPGQPIDEQTPSGIWAFDTTTGSLNHVCSPENSQMHSASPLMVISDSTTRFFLGSRTQNGTGDNQYGIWIEDLEGSQTGYFVTPELEADSVQDIYEEIILKTLHNSNSSITVKYRTTNNPSLPIVVESAEWLDTDTINTTDDLSALTVGDEIEILDGTNAGKLAHITEISQSEATYSIIVDENIGTVGETCDVRFDNWRKVNTTYTQSDGELKRIGIGAPGTWCQFKVYYQGSGGYPETRGVIVKSNNKQSL